MKNTSFWRAMNALAHPLSLGAILLLLLNDHVLRQFWPSWWTGKLGDFAWLTFAPLALAALLAWLIPSRLKRQETIVGLLAFSLTGLVFALAKTLPAFHALTVRILETSLGGPVGLVRDPTDLIALPALLVGWHLWQRPRLPSLRERGWVALALAALATVANQPITLDYGINYLETQEQTLFAAACYSSRSTIYASHDGGLSWQRIDPQGFRCTERHGALPLIASTDGQVQYRFYPGRAIERSNDGGQTWQREMTLKTDQARAVYFEKRGEQPAFRPQYQPGPLDALVHLSTGNLVMAMGLEGVLVRTPDAQWHWVSIGPYHLATLNTPGTAADFLQKEIWLSLILIGLLSSTLTQRVHRTRWGIFWLLVAWGMWGITVFASPAISYRPDVYVEVARPVIDTLIIAAAILAGLRGLNGLTHLSKQLPRARLCVIPTAVISALLFILPYVLWSQGVIPEYSTARLLALAAVAAAILAGDRCVRHLQRKAQV